MTDASLFFSDPGLVDPVAGRPVIVTPVGPVLLDASFGGTSVGEPATYRPAPGVELLAWDTPSYRAELVFAEPDVLLPEDLTVVGVRAGVWRVRARQSIRECVFRAVLSVPPKTELVGGPSSGQFLDALEWRAGDWDIALGTQDFEGLVVPPAPVQPRAWAALSENKDACMVSVVEYHDHGLAITLPAVEPGEVGQVHFIAAWSRALQDGENAAWYAVDASAPMVLAKVVGPAV